MSYKYDIKAVSYLFNGIFLKENKISMTDVIGKEKKLPPSTQFYIKKEVDERYKQFVESTEMRFKYYKDREEKLEATISRQKGLRILTGIYCFILGALAVSLIGSAL